MGSCDAPITYSGPDSNSSVVQGHCTDNAHNIGTGTFAFKYDATAPTMSHTIIPATPNSNGWYSGNVTMQFLDMGLVPECILW